MDGKELEMASSDVLRHGMTRRRVLRNAAAGGLALLSPPAWAQATVDLPAPGGPFRLPITTAFPQKGAMILQRTRPPWLETPFEVFDKGVMTPNDQFYVSWHWASFPTDINVDKFNLRIRGHVDNPLTLTLKQILHEFPQVELAAVNQCSGNSRLFFQPAVAGCQWANGAMGNALWTGIRLKDVLDRAGVKAGALQVRFSGLDDPLVPGGAKFMKSLDVDHARDGEVMIAYAMNGESFPVVNGFPIRLVVPGWFSVYWLKMLNDIEVLDQPDTNWFTTTGYHIPDTPRASITPGQADVKTVPITRMVPRSFITNIRSGDSLPSGAPTLARGIAFGGDRGVARVDLSIDQGKSWQPTQLGKDEGKYSFRQWQAQITLPSRGQHVLMVRCTNTDGLAQPDVPIWNPGGYDSNTIESTRVTAS
jgi:DMSO/TMAO reductase YedYZ molybdopterin-dependent catalytic subunit